MSLPDILQFKVPADGKEIFEIGDFSFDIIQENSNWEIPAFSKELHTHIVARTTQVKRAREAKLLDDDAEGDEAIVHIDFPGIGIYKNGIPTGSFDVKDDKCEATYAYVRKEGFEYRLDFSGTVTFSGNWVAYNGYLKPPYDDKPCFPVKIYKKFNAGALDWSNYKFTSYEETLEVSPEIVRYLYLTNPDFEKVPDRLLTFINLKELVIACSWPLEVLPLRSLPEGIGALQMLEQISINGTGFEALPEGMAALKNLARFYFNKGQLRRIPEGLLRLPRLEHLMLSGHQLTVLPQQVHLPAIRSLDFSNNKLKTIPAILLRQKSLNTIDLQGNPLQVLPKEINAVENVKLSISDKVRLMDFDYKGADGNGTIAWNDHTFYAQYDATLVPLVEAAFKENEVTTYTQSLLSLAKRSIAFQLTGEEDYSTIGNHRFGGMPDLPAAMNYPVFMHETGEGEHEYLYEFIAQVNCEAIRDMQDYLPRKGMLFFFLETLHNIYGRSAGNPCKVIYVEDTEGLQSGNRFQFSAGDYFEMYNPSYSAGKANAVKEISFPSFYASYVNKYLFKGDAEPLKDEKGFDDGLFEGLTGAGANGKEYQHAINVYGFTQHESPELQASLKLKGNPEDWIILLKVSSSGDFMWGDAGDLFFVIHKSDLAKANFDNVFVTLESS